MNTREEIADLLQSDYKLMLNKETGKLLLANPLNRDLLWNERNNICLVQDMTPIDWVVLAQELLGKINNDKEDLPEILFPEGE